MDNGALIFIIIIEAIVIAWQASKLKQYQKIEHLLNTGAVGVVGTSQTSQAAVAAPDAPVPAKVPPNTARSAAAGPVSRVDNDDEELLDMPGVEPEANIEEAKRVQLVMARCHYAEFYLEQLDDDYERGQFQRIVNRCMSTARNIDDPFFRASALQPLIILLDRAEWTTERDKLLAEVDDDIVRQRISDEMSARESG